MRYFSRNKQVAPSKYDTGENGLPPPTDDPKASKYRKVKCDHCEESDT